MRWESEPEPWRDAIRNFLAFVVVAIIFVALTSR
jgi:hypothetical protein